MKKTIVSMFAMGLAVSALTAFAQEPASSPSTTTPPENLAPKRERHRIEKGGPGGEGPIREVLESLTPAERTQFQEARKKAMEDPAVVEAKKNADAARQEAFSSMKSAMLQQDPSLASILDKVQGPGDFKNLTPEERQKLQVARKAARPGKEALPKGAPAEKAFHDALHTAMLKTDPSVGPILEKVEAAMKEKGEKMREERREGHNKNNPGQL